MSVQEVDDIKISGRDPEDNVTSFFLEKDTPEDSKIDPVADPRRTESANDVERSTRKTNGFSFFANKANTKANKSTNEVVLEEGIDPLQEQEEKDDDSNYSEYGGLKDTFVCKSRGESITGLIYKNPGNFEEDDFNSGDEKKPEAKPIDIDKIRKHNKIDQVNIRETWTNLCEKINLDSTMEDMQKMEKCKELQSRMKDILEKSKKTNNLKDKEIRKFIYSREELEFLIAKRNVIQVGIDSLR